MAKSKAAKQAASKGGGLASTLMAVALVSICAGGIGFISGSQIRQLLNSDKPSANTFVPAQFEGGQYQVVALPPIVTNLAGGEGGWVRLEAVVLVEGKRAVPNELTARLAQDTTALLRTLSISQISGASGFQHLREELMDRLKTRSADRVREIMIQSLVIE